MIENRCVISFYFNFIFINDIFLKNHNKKNHVEMIIAIYSVFFLKYKIKFSTSLILKK